MENKLYFASYQDFNDPFDCQLAFSWKATRMEWGRKLREIYGPLEMKQKLEAQFGAGILEDDQRLKEGGVFALDRSGDGEKARCAVMESRGILCLSKKNDDILMWSHYADHHRGICLEFRVLPDTLFETAFRVQYHQHFPKANAVTTPPDKLAEVLVATKSEHWKYEKEWRILKTVNTNRLFAYSPELLSGVIFGCAMSSKKRDRVCQWLSERHSPVNLYEAFKAPKRFALQIRKVGEIP